MIFPIIRAALISLRRDLGALALSFVLPIVFFSIFAVIFGETRSTTAKISVILVDQDQSTTSRRLVKGLQREGALSIQTKPAQEDVEYTATTAEAAVKRGNAPLALIIPHRFGDNSLAFGPTASRPAIQLLEDRSDQIAAQIVYGLLQEVAMTSMADVMFEQGVKYMDRLLGGFTPEQRRQVQEELEQIRERENQPDTSPVIDTAPVAVSRRDVLGESKEGSMVSFYAAGIRSDVLALYGERRQQLFAG